MRYARSPSINYVTATTATYQPAISTNVGVAVQYVANALLTCTAWGEFPRSRGTNGNNKKGAKKAKKLERRRSSRLAIANPLLKLIPGLVGSNKQ